LRNTRVRRTATALALVLAAGLLTTKASLPASAVPNPVATNEATYQAYGRVFPDPQGCLSHDTDGDDVNDVVAPGASPWAKGNVCVAQFLQYQEFVDGMKFLESLYPRFIQVIRLDERYKNPDFRSAGLPRLVAFEDGKTKVLGRDRRPLYMLKVTDAKSSIPEDERLHFVYSGSIHGIERAGAEGQIRAAEDLVTWAATMPNKNIVETKTDKPVPTAGEVLKRSVVYFVFPNPDGWGRGQVSPVEMRDGSPNLSYSPGFYFQRYNGNGMDLNRDFPTFGYTYRPYTPGSNPETRAHVAVLRRIRKTISKDNPVGQRFAGGIDLHGQLVADAFSYTLAGAAQRDYRKNFLTVDQGLRTWSDQSARLAWSSYIGGLFPVADQWGTTIDTIGYTITGGIGDWFEQEANGLGAVGIDNEMSLSHITPNTAYEPALEQMHIDGNKGLIYSQISSMLTEKRSNYVFAPTGKIGYVFNPHRVQVEAQPRKTVPRLPPQHDIDVIAPCESADMSAPIVSCDEAGTTYNAADNAIEFTVKGPKDGVWNGGIHAAMTNLNVLGPSIGTLSRIVLEQFDEGEWDEAQTSFVQAGQPDLYLQGGQDVAVNDPAPGKWRVRITNPAVLPARLTIHFDKVGAEMSYGQVPIDSSSMDFFTDLNKYVTNAGDKLEPVRIGDIVSSPSTLAKYDSLVVVNNLGQPRYLSGQLGLTSAEQSRYFGALKSFANGGGNLVLTDAALGALSPMNVMKASDVKTGRFLAGRYEFGDSCNDTKLTKDVCLEGTAGGTSRQAVEPTPIGYSPDIDLDDAPERMMPAWWVNSDRWDKACPTGCTEASLGGDTEIDAGPPTSAALGQRPLGKGVVRIAGVMFPDPNYKPGSAADMRFGLASYALTFSAWQTFLNLVSYRR
jgi:zinc carboxypeptidase